MSIFSQDNGLLNPISIQTEPSVPNPSGLSYFISYLNVLEGIKSKIKNLHWAAKKLPNADKRGAHLYLDEFLDIVVEFQDTVAESSQGILGIMETNAICGTPFTCSSTKELVDYMKSKTEDFYNNLPSGTDYVGIKSETEVFIKDITKYNYLFQLTE